MLCHLSQEWTKLGRPEGASWPVERDTHAACSLNYGEEHPQLLVTGGVDKDGNTLQDAWILDVNSGRWREVSGDECVTGSTESVVQTRSISFKLCCCKTTKLTNHRNLDVCTNFQNDVRISWTSTNFWLKFG